MRAGLRGQCAGRWLPVCMCLCVFVCLCVNARWAERAVRWAMAACMYVFYVCLYVCVFVGECVSARWAERAVRWAMAACMYVFMCVCMFVCLWVSV